MSPTDLGNIISNLEASAERLQTTRREDIKALHLWASIKSEIDHAVRTVTNALFPSPPPCWQSLRLAFDCFGIGPGALIQTWACMTFDHFASGPVTTTTQHTWGCVMAYLRGKYPDLPSDFGAYEGPTIKQDDQQRWIPGSDGKPTYCEEDYDPEDWLKKMRLAAEHVIIALHRLAGEARAAVGDVPCTGDLTSKPAADRQEAADKKTPASPAGSKRYMTVEQADAEAKKQVKKLRKSFFSKSKRQQAELIGCHHLTWEKTPLFQSAVKKGRIPAPQPRAPKAVSLTKNREAVTGEGGKDEVLRQLTADSAADYEPSPLADDPPGRERKVRSRKRL